MLVKKVLAHSLRSVVKRRIYLPFIFLSVSACTSAQLGELSTDIKNDLNQKLLGKSAPLPGDLDHVFANHPYMANVPGDSQYPKVIFTVVVAPNNHADAFANFGNVPPKGCWKLSATVWQSATQQRDVPPFQACMPEVLPQARVTTDLYVRWWSSLITTHAPDSSRSNPARPPATVFPQGLGYVRYFDARRVPAAPELLTVESWFWTAILYRLDFDPSVLSDRRVWIAKYVPVEG
jgi:hypothetical protein